MLQSDTQINYNDNKCGDSVQDRIQPEMDLGNQRGHNLSRHPRGCPSVRVSSGLWGRCCSSSLCSGGNLEVGSDVEKVIVEKKVNKTKSSESRERVELKLKR